MNRYTKIIGLSGIYYTKEFVKKKHHKNKIREIKPETVAKEFLKGDVEVLVYFWETDREILITPFSSPEDIRKYLGKEFI